MISPNWVVYIASVLQSNKSVNFKFKLPPTGFRLAKIIHNISPQLIKFRPIIRFTQNQVVALQLFLLDKDSGNKIIGKMMQ